MRAIVFILLGLGWGIAAHAMSAQKAHELIAAQQPELLGNKELVSLYYFGREGGVSVVGLERLDEGYLPVRWLLLFQHDTLLGWYHPLPDFPARLENGQLYFPKGSDIDPLGIRVPRPFPIVVNSQNYAFHSLLGSDETHH